MGCGCGSGGGASGVVQTQAWTVTPARGEVRTFTISEHGPNAKQRADLYAARNGGGHVRPVSVELSIQVSP